MDFDPVQYTIDKAVEYGVDPRLAVNMLHRESGLDPTAVSGKGAQGYFQLMPGTARDLGVDPSDPRQNIEGGVRYLSQLGQRHGNDPILMAASYNAGPGAVQRYGGVPPYRETQAYVAGVVPQGDDDGTAAFEAIPENPAEVNKPDPRTALFDAIPEGQPKAQAAPQMGDAAVVQSNGAAVPLVVQNAVLARQKAGKFDPNARLGSELAPTYSATATDIANNAPGDWYYTPDGQLHQAPGTAPKESMDEGLNQGMVKVLGNVGLLGVDALKHVGVNADGIAHSLGVGSVQDALTANEQYLANLRETKNIVPSKVGRLIGEGIATLPTVLMGEGLLPAIAGGAIAGGLTTDKRDLLGIAGDAALGGVGGAAVHGLVKGATGLLAPTVSAPVRTIIDNGGIVTPGMALGRTAQKVEDLSAKTMPAIAASQNRVADAFATKVAPNAFLAPLKKAVPDGAKGYEINNFIDGAVDDAYKALKPKISVTGDQQFANDMAAVDAARAKLAPAQQSELDRHLDNLFAGKFDQNGVMSGEDFQSLYSDLGTIGQNYLRDPIVANRELGGVLKQTQNALDNAVGRQNAPLVDDILAARKAAQGNMVMRDAAGRGSSTEGEATPGAIRQAVVNQDRSYKHSKFYTGDAFGQDVADAANIVRNRAPNTGAAMSVPFAIGAGAEGINTLAHMLGASPLPYGTGAAAVTAANLAAGAIYNPVTESALRHILSPGVKRTAAAKVLRGLLGPSAGEVGGLLTNDDAFRSPDPTGVSVVPRR